MPHSPYSVIAFILFVGCDDSPREGATTGQARAEARSAELPPASSEETESSDIPPSGSPSSSEAYPPAPLRVSFAWANEDRYGSGESVPDDAVLEGTLTNLTGGELVVEVHALADAGTNYAVKHQPSVVELPAQGSLAVSVSLDSFGFDFQAQDFSGNVGLKFRAYDESENGDYDTIYATPLYYHPTDDSFLVYGAKTLRETYHGGDYKGLEVRDPDPKRVIHRMVAGVRVDYSPVPRTAEDLVLEGDDGAPGGGAQLYVP